MTRPTPDTRRPSVLLADDDTAITEQLGPLLERSGFDVRTAHDGTAALAAATGAPAPDLVVLDVLMPHMDGREVLRRIRADGAWIPVILLTQVGESTERAMALEEGADDYLNKPFDPYELIARMRALLRRSRTGLPPLASSRVLRAGALRVDRTARRAWLADRELVLTPKAGALLDYLVTHPDELLSRERLMEVLWGWESASTTRAVDNRVAELRRALGDDPAAPAWIETVTGEGYRFVPRVEAER
ncbi:response regulator transcription factor [Yinghuangia seranimata]|uniref:response regulator transcription factor n=1 Tax=Yinghuangia seranimata TaxID=408067 RepID=UPI00248B61E1|nr:response regulator transcription factor [Yinghuangia seranimata]MDI2125945.1 response regulator transcription factor [Yinghuangia seranimata]